MTLLDTINSREALCALNDAQLRQLCDEIRQFLVLNVARTGGHLASNLGVVELSVALERVFDTSRDRLLFDVGHQSYVHKILTGRRDEFRTLRMFGGLAGFPKPSESVTDPFVAGHASSSVSTALGMARARTLQHEDYHVVALMGDGAMTGGLAYEAMNDAGESSEQLIVILNDNGMSITPNVGGIAQYLALIRTRPGYYRIKKAYRAVTAKVPGGKCLYRLTHRLKEHWKRMLFGTTFFEEMGFEYYGPVDGHDLKRLEYMLRLVKDRRHPVLLHVITQKGKGYAPAEENPDVFHGIGHFDPEKGMEPRCGHLPTFSDTFSETIDALGAQEPRICAITAAMLRGTGLDAFAAHYPERCFDVGIAEGHAVSMAGGFTDCLLQKGAKKVFAIDVGYGQLAWSIRQDPRVVCMERTNIRYVTPEQLGEPLDLSVVDVSFISLRIVLPAIRALLKPTGQILCLIKPQFEAGREKVGKKGVVRDPAVHEEVLQNFLALAAELELTVRNLTFSPVRGPEGNIEFLGHLSMEPQGGITPDVPALVAQAHAELRE